MTTVLVGFLEVFSLSVIVVPFPSVSWRGYRKAGTLSAGATRSGREPIATPSSTLRPRVLFCGLQRVP